MFELCIIFGVVVLVWVAFSEKTKDTTKTCEKQHRWVIRFENNDKKGYLVCKVCGKIPGDD